MVENGQVAPLKSTDVDNSHDSSWDSEEGVEPITMEIKVIHNVHAAKLSIA